MIKLYDICSKLEGLLNGTDAEITGTSPVTNKYFFKVYSEGLYLTTIFDKTKGKNFIPVIVGALGGEINPVPELGEVDYNVAVQLFFPVRFKDDFYALNDFLVENFVGKTLTYGTVKALSNISVAQYGELQNLNLKEYNEWIVNTYKVQNEYVGKFMSMTFTLYLSSAKNLNQANGFIYGNEWKTQIDILGKDYYEIERDNVGTVTSAMFEKTSVRDYRNAEIITSKCVVEIYKINGSKKQLLTNYEVTSITYDYLDNRIIVIIEWDETYPTSFSVVMELAICTKFFSDNSPAFITETDISQSEINSQQILGETSAKSLPTITSYVKDLPIYIKNNSQYKELIENFLERKTQNLIVRIIESCPTLLQTFSISHDYFLANMSLVKSKGDLLGITLSLAERLDL